MDTTGNGHDEDEFFLEMTDDASESEGVQGDDAATDVCYTEGDLPPGAPDLDSGELRARGGHVADSSGVAEVQPENLSQALEETEVLDQQDEFANSEGKESSDSTSESYGQLLADYEAVKAERDKFKEQLVRKAADLDNYRKRVAREREDQKRYGNEKFALELLPIMDNMERAVSACEGGEGTNVSSLKDGVEMVYKQLVTALKRFGVEGFKSAGTMFDPQKHEAIQQVETDQWETGMVVEEFQKGYFINDRLLRPAMVSVAKNPND